MQKIIFRADGNEQIGLGHISRCLAIAEALCDEYQIAFAIQNPHDSLRQFIPDDVGEIISLKDARDGIEFLSELHQFLSGEEIVVLDGYHFDAEYQKQLKPVCKALICIDDIPERHFFSDIIINYCGGIDPELYKREFYTQIFSGLEYAVLRKPFSIRPFAAFQFNSRLFLNMGGADNGNATCEILQQLSALGFKGDITVVVGKSYTHWSSLEDILKHSNLSVKCLQGLSAGEMYAEMAGCSIAILPPSTVSLEFLSTGGLIFLHQTAGNQAFLKRYLISNGLAIDYSAFSDCYSTGNFQASFASLIEVQKKTFDGKAPARLKRILDSLVLSTKMEVRRATLADMNISYEWANDSETRKYSYTQDRIPWTDHVSWFNRKLSDPDCFYFIASIEGTPVGQMRFDKTEDDDNVFVISYLLDKNWRGKGLATYLILKSMQSLSELKKIKKVVAYVRNINIGSIKVFKRIGFKVSEQIPQNYPDSVKFELSF